MFTMLRWPGCQVQCKADCKVFHLISLADDPDPLSIPALQHSEPDHDLERTRAGGIHVWRQHAGEITKRKGLNMSRLKLARETLLPVLRACYVAFDRRRKKAKEIVVL